MGARCLASKGEHFPAGREEPLKPEAGDRPPILVVDDENGPRQALRILLKEDYAVHLAASAEEAIGILQEESIELIVTDVRMPEKSGVDLLREAKEIHPEVQVIILTGYGQLETAVKAVEYGAFAYMGKPFDNDAMLEMVRAGLDKHRVERDRRALEFLSLQANRFETLGRVVSGMLHDFGSPLTVLCTQIEMLSERPDRDDLADRLAVMKDQVGHCSDMVRSTMDFVRHDSESFVQLDVNDLVETCLSLVAPLLREHRVEVKRQLGEALPAMEGDLVLLRQAVMNIVTNACRAMESQEGARDLGIDTWASDGNVFIAVDDTGPGIPEEMRAEIFKTFFTTKGESGTGLGLSVVKNVMGRHGGNVSLEEAAGGGARFVLQFPLSS